MTRIYDLVADETGEEHLWTHGLYVEDAYQVVDEGRYKVFADDGHDDRVKVVGPDKGGRLLTVVVAPPDRHGTARVITGWPADQEEQNAWSRAGGTQHVRR